MERQIEVRPMRPEDYPRVAAIYRYYVDHSTASFELTAPDDAEMSARLREISTRYPAFVVTSDGLVTGYAYAHEWKARAAYAPTVESTVYLHPAVTGRGMGKLLMSSLIGACRERGYRAMIADITVGNDASIALHKALGFECVSLFKDVGSKFGQVLSVTDYQLLL